MTFKKARAVKFSLFYFLILLTLVNPAHCKEINPIVLSAYTDLLDLNFDKARDKLKFVNSNPEENPYELYVSNLNDALEVYISDNYELFDSYKDLESMRLKRIARLPEEMPEKLFLDAEIRIHWAFVHLKFGQHLKAFWGFKQAYSSALEGSERFPEFIAYQKSLGVLHTIFGSFPNSYNWMLSLLNMEGNIKLGMTELDAVSNSNSVFKLETKIYKAIFETYLLNEGQKAVESLKALLEDQNPNLATKVVGTTLLIQNGESQKAEEYLTELEATYDRHKITFIYYLLGVINLQKGNYPTSIQYFQIFVSQYGGQNFRKDAYCKIAICHWLNNDYNYTFYIQKTMEEGETIIDTDKNAQKMVENGTLPNKNLLKIRYATDGGYFENVDKILRSTSESNFKYNQELTEFHYRKARFFHKSNRLNEALNEYAIVIRLQTESADYFAPNSCLQIGYIYLSKKSYEKARQYFQEAMEYEGHPYKYSIDKKAEIELEYIDDIINNN